MWPIPRRVHVTQVARGGGLTGQGGRPQAPRVARRQLPTGTVTLVFTDIEGSTRLLQELGNRYGEVLGEHRRILREAFQRHGGVEVDTQGDAFFYAFPTSHPEHERVSHRADEHRRPPARRPRACQGRARENGVDLNAAEKMALYYLAIEPRLANARQLREFAVRAVERLMPGEDALKYDHLFGPGDPENKAFWMQWRPYHRALVNRFVAIAD
jgi:class 3 adenylate cyclase